MNHAFRLVVGLQIVMFAASIVVLLLVDRAPFVVRLNRGLVLAAAAGVLALANSWVLTGSWLALALVLFPGWLAGVWLLHAASYAVRDLARDGLSAYRRFRARPERG